MKKPKENMELKAKWWEPNVKKREKKDKENKEGKQTYYNVSKENEKIWNKNKNKRGGMSDTKK